jgi:hypothetical protein
LGGQIFWMKDVAWAKNVAIAKDAELDVTVASDADQRR